jgi:hypothetical protein
LRDFLLDSTVIGGLLALTQGGGTAVVGTAAAAGALSTGIRYLVRERSQKKTKPSKLLADGVRKAQMKSEE